MNRRTPCQYAVLRFRPYAETGEFVNVGLAVSAPEAGEYVYLCNARRRRRVTGFFPELDYRVYQAAMESMARELARLKSMLDRDLVHGTTPEKASLIFKELTRPREGMLAFGLQGVLLAESAEAAAEELKARYIDRQFAQKREYQEKVMQRQLREFLRRHHLRDFYATNQIVGDERFHVVLPFVHEQEGRMTKALKPLDLDRKEPTDVYQHGDEWLTKLKRLREFGHAPDRMVFPVHLPQIGATREAAVTIVRELRAANTEVVDFEDKAALEQAVRVQPTLIKAGDEALV